MTTDDKINLLYNLKHKDSAVLNHDSLEFLIDCVKRNIPEKPIVEVGRFGIHKDYTCPICGSQLLFDIGLPTKFCEDCGQLIALDGR